MKQTRVTELLSAASRVAQEMNMNYLESGLTRQNDFSEIYGDVKKHVENLQALLLIEEQQAIYDLKAYDQFEQTLTIKSSR